MEANKMTKADYLKWIKRLNKFEGDGDRCDFCGRNKAKWQFNNVCPDGFKNRLLICERCRLPFEVGFGFGELKKEKS